MKKALAITTLLLLAASCGDDVDHYTTEKNGVKCSTTAVPNGALIQCDDGTMTTITNGEDGVDGKDGKDAPQVELVVVCPEDDSMDFPETLVKVQDTFMAFLASPKYKKERLTLLEEDRLYETTDGRNHHFEIVNGEIEMVSVCAPN